MRRTTAGITIVLLIGLLAAPALARRYTNFTFATQIEEGQRRATVRARNCWSEPGYVAKVQVSVRDPQLHKIRLITKRADDDGTTLVPIRTGNLTVGKYEITVKCIHKFDSGGRGIWYTERGRFRVVPRP